MKVNYFSVVLAHDSILCVRDSSKGWLELKFGNELRETRKPLLIGFDDLF